MTCIHSASENGHYHLVESLLTDGVDVNSRDEEDETPLNLAARRGFMNIVGLLIAKGADQKLKNKYGVSAAIWAMTESHVDVVIFLLRIAVEKKDNLLDVVNACDKV
jgi:ankyrin repeat protein